MALTSTLHIPIQYITVLCTNEQLFMNVEGLKNAKVLLQGLILCLSDTAYLTCHHIRSCFYSLTNRRFCAMSMMA